MKVEVLLTETEIAKEFAESMQARDLPEKFFYWFPLSVNAWTSRQSSALPNEPKSPWGVIGEHIGPITAHFAKTVPVISLGSGDGKRDLVLLRKLMAGGKPVHYFPVDASQTLLEMACAAAEDLDMEGNGIKADISSRMHLLLAADAAEAPRLFLLAGNTIGGFDPLEQIKIVAECMKPGDRLIVDTEIFSEEAVAAASDAGARQLAMAPLLSVGVTPENGEINFDHKSDARHAGLHLITKYFHALEDMAVTVAGQEISLARGERIFLNFKYLCTSEAFEWLLVEHGGLKILGRDTQAAEGVIRAVCSR